MTEPLAALVSLAIATLLVVFGAWLSHRPRFDSLAAHLAAALPRKGLTP